MYWQNLGFFSFKITICFRHLYPYWRCRSFRLFQFCSSCKSLMVILRISQKSGSDSFSESFSYSGSDFGPSSSLVIFFTTNSFSDIIPDSLEIVRSPWMDFTFSSSSVSQMNIISFWINSFASTLLSQGSSRTK